MSGPKLTRAGAPLEGLSPREFLVRLVLAEVVARPGEGPLAPRFGRVRPAPRDFPKPEGEAWER